MTRAKRKDEPEPPPRSQVEADVAEFLARGGRVERVPMGKSGDYLPRTRAKGGGRGIDIATPRR